MKVLLTMEILAKAKAWAEVSTLPFMTRILKQHKHLSWQTEQFY